MEDERRPSRGGAEIDGERSLGTRGRGRESAGSWAGVGPSGEEGQQRSMSMGRGSARRCSGSVSVRASGEERERILRMAILSMDSGIHGYPTQWARVWWADYTHGFHGADIQ
jgi:hypothetical protein